MLFMQNNWLIVVLWSESRRSGENSFVSIIFASITLNLHFTSTDDSDQLVLINIKPDLRLVRRGERCCMVIAVICSFFLLLTEYKFNRLLVRQCVLSHFNFRSSKLTIMISCRISAFCLMFRWCELPTACFRRSRLYWVRQSPLAGWLFTRLSHLLAVGWCFWWPRCMLLAPTL